MRGGGAAPARRKLFVDVSETLVGRGNTGIQRVVRRIVAEAPAPASAAGFDLVPVVATTHGLRALNAAGMTNLMTPVARGAGVPNASVPLADELPPPGSWPVRVIKGVLARAPGFYETLRTRRLDRVFDGLIAPGRLRVGAADIYLVLDSFWMHSAAPREAERLRRRGLPVVGLIYDVLALTDPTFFARNLPVLLERQFRRMAAAGVRFVSISATAAGQTEAMLPTGAAHPVLYFPLGHDIPAGAGRAGDHARAASPAGGDMESATPTFLVVGTIEARKNHRVVLNAFEQLWATGWRGRLMIVGKAGWGIDDVFARIVAHAEHRPGHAPRLTVLHDATDAQLAAAYRAATATIVPSLAEGFGLPIIESLAFGVPVIASDIPVFREIVGADPLLFDPRDPATLVTSVQRLLADLPAHRRAAAAFRWPDWQASAAALIDRVVRQADRGR